jgi:hypothetical protein
MFVSHFMHVFSQYPEAHMGIIFHHEGTILTHVMADPSSNQIDLYFKEIFRELKYTFPLIGDFQEGVFETESNLWLIYPLTTSLKIGLAVHKQSTRNQARFWLNELASQIKNSL